MPFRWLIAAVLLMPLAGHGNEEEDLKSAVITRCMYEVAEFGEELVRICIDEDLAAANALAQYPANFAEIVNNCSQRRQNHAWAMVKVCADMEIAAEAALTAYDGKYAPLIEECRAKTGKQGPAKVKACVDQAIEGK
ncbi:MAG: hypothetical protein HY067_22285 [Betaproteobacteria bacterium]|nr:hypothetical protein [Betaproteobacteria bacterium]